MNAYEQGKADVCISISDVMYTEYASDDMIVRWQPKLCRHADICVKTLPHVYNPKASPWIAVEMRSPKH